MRRKEQTEGWNISKRTRAPRRLFLSIHLSLPSLVPLVSSVLLLMLCLFGMSRVLMIPKAAVFTWIQAVDTVRGVRFGRFGRQTIWTYGHMIEKPFSNNNSSVNLHTTYSNKNKYASVSQPCKHGSVI